MLANMSNGGGVTSSIGGDGADVAGRRGDVLALSLKLDGPGERAGSL